MNGYAYKVCPKCKERIDMGNCDCTEREIEEWEEAMEEAEINNYELGKED